jgi:hypothetical protein
MRIKLYWIIDFSMKKYLDISGNSGVSAYESGHDCIMVKFRDSGKVYRYSYRSAGKRAVDKMKALAVTGKGLSTYITRYVREKYESVS